MITANVIIFIVLMIIGSSITMASEVASSYLIFLLLYFSVIMYLVLKKIRKNIGRRWES